MVVGLTDGEPTINARRRSTIVTLKRIRLELARNKDFPEGSAEHGYEFRAPLRPDGHIDLEGWADEAPLSANTSPSRSTTAKIAYSR